MTGSKRKKNPHFRFSKRQYLRKKCISPLKSPIFRNDAHVGIIQRLTDKFMTCVLKMRRHASAYWKKNMCVWWVMFWFLLTLPRKHAFFCARREIQASYFLVDSVVTYEICCWLPCLQRTTDYPNWMRVHASSIDGCSFEAAVTTTAAAVVLLLKPEKPLTKCIQIVKTFMSHREIDQYSVNVDKCFLKYETISHMQCDMLSVR